MKPLKSWISALSSLLPVAAVLLAWHVVATKQWISSDVLPAPVAIWKAFVDLAASGELAANLGETIATSLMGLALGVLIGVALGLAMATSKIVEGFFGPIVKATYSLPKTALIPLLILWFGVGGITNLAVVTVTALLPVLVYTLNAARSVPANLSWSALSLGTKPGRLLWLVLLPGALPAIFTATRIALGFAFVVSISCEMVVSNYGIGKLMFLYGDNGNYDYMFAALTAVVIVAFLADALLVQFSRWLLRWDEGARANV